MGRIEAIFLGGKDGMHKKGMLVGTKSCDRGEGSVKGLLPAAHWRLVSVLWGVILCFIINVCLVCVPVASAQSF